MHHRGASPLDGAAVMGQKPCSLDLSIKLMSDYKSKDLLYRHIRALKLVVQDNVEGFAIVDLPKLHLLLQYAVESIVQGTTDLIEPTSSLLLSLSKPFVRRKASDDLLMEQYSIPLLGFCISLLFQKLPLLIHQCCLEALTTFSSSYENRLKLWKRQQSSSAVQGSPSGVKSDAVHQRVLRAIGAPSTAVAALQMAVEQKNEPLIQSIICFVLELSRVQLNCGDMIQAGVLSKLSEVLTKNYFPEPLILVDIFWNLLDRTSSSNKAMVAALNENNVAFLFEDISSCCARDDGSSFLLGQHPSNSQPYDVDAGGASMMPASIVDKDVSSRQIDQDQGLGDVIGHSNSVSEDIEEEDMPGSQPLDQAQAMPSEVALGSMFNIESECQQTFRTLLYLLSTLPLRNKSLKERELQNDLLAVMKVLTSHCASCGQILVEEGYFGLLLTSLTPFKDTSSTTWLTTGFQAAAEPCEVDTQVLLWGVIAHACVHQPCLAAALADGFHEHLMGYIHIDDGQGRAYTYSWTPEQRAMLKMSAMRNLLMLTWLCPALGRTPGVLDSLARWLSPATPSAYVTVILQVIIHVSLHAPEPGAAAGPSALVPALTALFQHNLHHLSALENPLTLVLLSAACAHHGARRQQARDGNVVGCLLRALAAIRGQLDMMSPPMPYMLALLECCWACILPEGSIVEEFVAGQGIELLLDILENSKSPQLVILTLLADILRFPVAASRFRGWTSQKHSYNAVKVLLRLWQDEDEKRGMTVGGVIANIKHPLRGLQHSGSCPPQHEAFNSHESYPQLLALMDQCRRLQLLDKIYVVLNVIGDHSTAGLVDSFPAEDMAALIVIEEHFNFRQGEVWQQIAANLEQAGVTPTVTDGKRLAAAILQVEQLAMAVKGRQEKLIECCRQKEIEAELHAHVAIIKAHTNDEFAVARLESVNPAVADTLVSN